MKLRWVVKELQCDAKHRWTAIIGPGKSTLCPTCGDEGYRPDPIAPMSPTVVGDELWGGARFIHNLDVEPVWVETKSQYRAECAARGFENRVRHVPIPGTDKAEHTTSWITGPPRGFDPRPFAMLTPDEQRTRRAEAAERMGCSVEELALLSESLESAGLERPAEIRQAMTFEADR